MSDVTEAAALTIDELARQAAMTVRNVRAHQSRGLLPPPEIRGRTGFYGPEHLTRLELIRELQDQGFNLESIRRLLAQSNGSSGELLGFARALMEPFGDEEEPAVMSLPELAELSGGGPEVLRRAVELNFVRPLGGDRYEVASPRLLAAGHQLRELGVPSDRVLAVAAELQRHAAAVSETFVDLFIDAVWKPFQERGRPAAEWPAVRSALERLRPLAGEAVDAVFRMEMSSTVEKAFGRELARSAKGGRRPGRR